MSTAAIVILVIVLLAVLFAAGWFLGGQARSRRLRQRFGPEYDRHVQEADDRRAAERELAAREKRHSQLELRPLSDSARTRYTEEWARVQEQFVDDPGGAVVTADELLQNVMRDRGYPTDGFDQQAADLSVEHAAVVGHYRSGHDIWTRHERTEATTEDLRQALVHYRTIFHELVGDADGRHEHGDDRIDDRADDRIDDRIDHGSDDRVDDRGDGRGADHGDGVAVPRTRPSADHLEAQPNRADFNR